MTRNLKDANSLSTKLAQWKLAHHEVAEMTEAVTEEAMEVDAENTNLNYIFLKTKNYPIGWFFVLFMLYFIISF